MQLIDLFLKNLLYPIKREPAVGEVGSERTQGYRHRKMNVKMSGVYTKLVNVTQRNKTVSFRIGGVCF